MLALRKKLGGSTSNIPTTEVFPPDTVNFHLNFLKFWRGSVGKSNCLLASVFRCQWEINRQLLPRLNGTDGLKTKVRMRLQLAAVPWHLGRGLGESRESTCTCLEKSTFRERGGNRCERNKMRRRITNGNKIYLLFESINIWNVNSEVYVSSSNVKKTLGESFIFSKETLEGKLGLN